MKRVVLCVSLLLLLLVEAAAVQADGVSLTISPSVVVHPGDYKLSWTVTFSLPKIQLQESRIFQRQPGNDWVKVNTITYENPIIQSPFSDDLTYVGNFVVTYDYYIEAEGANQPDIHLPPVWTMDSNIASVAIR